MAYFEKFNLITYNNTICTNLLQRVISNNQLPQQYFTYYVVQDGEKPETVAYKLYGNAEYHWVIILLNNIINPQFDWILSSVELTRYIDKKYGSYNGSLVHHYETTSASEPQLPAGTVVNSDFIPADWIVAVTNEEYESAINETKRQIKVINPTYLKQFERDIEKLLKVN